MFIKLLKTTAFVFAAQLVATNVIAVVASRVTIRSPLAFNVAASGAVAGVLVGLERAF